MEFAGHAELKDLVDLFTEGLPEDTTRAPQSTGPPAAGPGPLAAHRQSVLQIAEIAALEESKRALTRQLKLLDNFLQYEDLLSPEQVDAHIALLTKVYSYVTGLQRSKPKWAMLLSPAAEPGIAVHHTHKRECVQLFTAMMGCLQSVTGEAQAVEWLGSNPVDGKKLAAAVEELSERQTVAASYLSCLRTLGATLRQLHAVAVGPGGSPVA
eukprot:EG_transcript_29081